MTDEKDMLMTLDEEMDAFDTGLAKLPALGVIKTANPGRVVDILHDMCGNARRAQCETSSASTEQLRSFMMSLREYVNYIIDLKANTDITFTAAQQVRIDECLKHNEDRITELRGILAVRLQGIHSYKAKTRRLTYA